MFLDYNMRFLYSYSSSVVITTCYRQFYTDGDDIFLGLLGSVAPCVLYGTNAERLSSSSGSTFASHCLTYSGLYLIGNAFFGWNCLAPFFAARNRTAMRHKFNLQASYISFLCVCVCVCVYSYNG